MEGTDIAEAAGCYETEQLYYCLRSLSRTTLSDHFPRLLSQIIGTDLDHRIDIQAPSTSEGGLAAVTLAAVAPAAVALATAAGEEVLP